MPTLKLEYKILLSSPSDLAEERRVAMEVVSEVNSSWGVPNGAVIKTLTWENDVSPSFGAEPQDVINQQLGDSWDIYLGLMHARFGSPTQKYGSGTEEEFERAYELWKAEPEKRVLMFYFKKAPVDVDQLDLDQVAKVRLFRKKISDLGGLYKEFSDVENFKDLWRAHLTSVLVGLHKQQTQLAELPSAQNSMQTPAAESSITEAPLGILDFAEVTMASMTELTAAIEDFGDLMVKSTVHVETESNALRQASALGDLVGMRRSVSSISKDMGNLARGLATKRGDYNVISRRCFEALSKAISIIKTTPSSESGDMSLLVHNVTKLIETIDLFIVTLHGAERSLDSIPNLAKEFNTSRQLLKREFNNLRADLNASIGLLKDLRTIAESA